MARASHYDEHRKELLGLIWQAQLSHGKPPSIRSLANHFDVGVATMHSYLTKLHEEGHVEWRPGKHRSLKCTETGRQELS